MTRCLALIFCFVLVGAAATWLVYMWLGWER